MGRVFEARSAVNWVFLTDFLKASAVTAVLEKTEDRKGCRRWEIGSVAQSESGEWISFRAVEARPRVWRHGFLQTASFLRCLGQERPRVLERSPRRSNWTSCSSAAMIGPEEPASSSTH